MKTKVFVYGTLKSGHGNNRLLNQAQFLGEAVTLDKFFLTNGGFPYMILEEDGQEGDTARVKGELYEVRDSDTLNNLDWLEGVEHGHYKHHNVEVLLDDETAEEALCYVKATVGHIGRSMCEIKTFDKDTPFRDLGEYYEWS